MALQLILERYFLIQKVLKLQYTPEKAAAFVYLFTKGLKTAENKNTDINQLIKSNQKLGKEIVDQINKAELKVTWWKKLRGNIATLKISGK